MTKYERVEMFDVEVRAMIPVDQYKTLLVIAAKHQVTVTALVAELVRRGLGKRKSVQGSRLPADTLNAIVRLNQSGKSDKSIAVTVGVSQSAVSRHLRGLGLPSAGRPGRPRKSTAPPSLLVVGRTQK